MDFSTVINVNTNMNIFVCLRKYAALPGKRDERFECKVIMTHERLILCNAWKGERSQSMGNFKSLLRDRSNALIFMGRKFTDGDTSWIGGNAPAYFDDQKDFQSKYGSNYYFFLSLVNPLNPTMMFTIFFPREYDEYLENNKYPNCAVLLIEHPVSYESSTDMFTNPNMKKYAIGDCEVINNDIIDNQIFLVKFGGTPEHI
ncbi:hypothetical protein [Lysinibacillus sp. fls2-241-R2A-57]|uniref:hypothetical protein n=1 Tax=Lysinibacillus sp. fls2-241-R2A-57 TaxID=3040292 RepID=UPI00255439FA|nr:hypothetical protein [Lysinibacillus sp. fls2-241-R2A-57]